MGKCSNQYQKPIGKKGVKLYLQCALLLTFATASIASLLSCELQESIC